MTDSGAGSGERVFIRLGPPPEEPEPVCHRRRPQSYPAEVGPGWRSTPRRSSAATPARSALLPLLHLVQSEDGYLTPAGLEFCAEQLGLTGAEVSAVGSFYTMYRRGPTGDYLVGVCTNTLCAVMGGDAIFDDLKDHLGIGNDETTADGPITLEHIECNAACDYAPVVMVNWEFFDNQTPRLGTRTRRRAAGRRARRPPAVRRCAPSARPRASWPACPTSVPTKARAAPGAATLAGLRVAQENGMQAPTPPETSDDAGTPLTPVLSRFWDDPESWTMATYQRHDGYQALRKALAMAPDDVIGGQGVRPARTRRRRLPDRDQVVVHPAGRPGAAAKPHYLVVNADESEPGTCKDIPLMLATPHLLVEGVIIAAYAIRASHAFIYVRGEVLPVLRRLQNAVAEAYAAGYLGRDIMGSGFDLELVVHAGAGAYICGEETALLDSLEGRRGQPRLRPPFPAVAGLYGCPTVINNVETIASVPPIILNGVDWFRTMGTEKSPGFTLYSLSGHVTRPGQYEAPLGITLRELLDYAGGVRAGHQLKFWTPGGSSTPLLTAEHLDVPLDYEGVGAAGSMLGTKALEIFDETTCVVRAVQRWTDFYKHESCGKCTPCREGTFWLSQIYERLETGKGTGEDLDKLLDISDAILGKSFCALGDGAASPVMSSIQYFRDEYIAHVEGGGCPFDPRDSMLNPNGKA